MEELQRYQTDHLFLLVGGNPLPNYVAAKALLKHDDQGQLKGKLYFIHSNDTLPTAEALQKVLNCGNDSLIPVQDEADGYYIRKALTERVKHLPTNESVGLHYTGGTKVMAVHDYRALDKVRRNAIYSYLDPRTLTLRIEQGDAPSLRFELLKPDLRPLTMLNADTLLKLHRIDLHKPPRRTSILPDVAKLLTNHFLSPQERESWVHWRTCKKETKFEHTGWDKTLSFAACPFPDVIKLLAGATPSIHTAEDLLNYYLNRPDRHPNDPEWTITDAKAWITKNEWFEDYVFAAVQDLAQTVGLTDVCLSVESDKDGESYFEVDVIGLRGYQLFVWSCTTDGSKGACKEKLLEVSIRAKLLGGDEARFALVCFANVTNLALLHQELGSLLTKDIFKVFGAADLPTLSTHIGRWIQTVDREVV